MCSILITIYNVTLWTCPNNIEPDVESSPVPSPAAPAPSAAAPVPSPVPSPAPSPAPSLVAVIGVVAGDVVPSPAPSPVTVIGDVVPSPVPSPVAVIGDVVPSAVPSPVTVIGDIVPSSSVWTAPVDTDQLLLTPSPSVLVFNQTDVCRCNQDWQHVLWIFPVVILVAIVIFRKSTVNRIADTPPVRYLLRLRRARSWPSVSLRTVELPGRAQSEPIFDSIVV